MQSTDTSTGAAILLPAPDFSSGLSCPPLLCPPSFAAPALGVDDEPGCPVEDAVSAGGADDSVGLLTADDDAPPSSPPSPPFSVSASQVAASSPKT
ncbi:hypothetical protein PgNI_11430 [Pyricularia grisea]|uniref:Uncharacterized protein n=1 Tax=Pyricularia grisea TaxID=148305 RepID=A0A6P8AQ59_PYRGI|nr:hypothetical protein PgNI_11430 [Pyricularia grisea]TLD04179.1 hypothetical protein PgNI_11430 [Pyricularia grisea]